MRASIRADGTTFRLRCTSDPAGTDDPDSKVELEGVPHRDAVDVGTTTEHGLRRPPGGYKNYLRHPSGSKLLHDFVEQGEWGNMYTDLPCQS